ncbi:glutathione synthase [Paraphotobacterium marinum]|uniref:Glutathione synthetase n=1 Tax=Paraphotobacterium marinum TaxID=1755811 RepID=A0A220VC69_9GAMM|nr:glutathione synthase [Paraphotobacterium marinum]ASK77890.1 glutathione synthase [Paraphotobacterium marinum]
MMKFGIIMDPISNIKVSKDSNLKILLKAQERNYEIFYMELQDLYVEKGNPYALAKKIILKQNKESWFEFKETTRIPLSDLDVILMRKDPPFDIDYIYATYILDLAELKGTFVANKPQSLRDCNEKVYTSWFPKLTPETIITSNPYLIKDFHKTHKNIILKPLDGMGGASIFKVTENDPNLSVIIETLTNHGSAYCMAQEFIPDITLGDKRIIIINGEVMPYVLARIPAKGETRGNIAAGGTGVVQEISERDLNLAKEIAPILKQKGLFWVGLDVIGNKLTEINVTCPTCIVEIEQATGFSIADKILDSLEKKLKYE